MAVPHNDRRRRKAVASLVLALLAASKALMDTGATVGATGRGGAATGGGVAATRTAGGGRCCQACQAIGGVGRTPATARAPGVHPNQRGEKRRPYPSPAARRTSAAVTLR